MFCVCDEKKAIFEKIGDDSDTKVHYTLLICVTVQKLKVVYKRTEIRQRV